jgi:hypothetical protein
LHDAQKQIGHLVVESAIHASESATQPVLLQSTVEENLPSHPLPEADRDVDAYWQYYEDCDYWDVIFALFDDAHSRAIAVIAAQNSTLDHVLTRNLVTAIAGRNLFPAIHSTREMVREIAHQLAQQFEYQQFCEVESAGIHWARLSGARVNPLPHLCLIGMDAELSLHGSFEEAARFRLLRVRTCIRNGFLAEVVPRIDDALAGLPTFERQQQQIQIAHQAALARRLGWLGHQLVQISEDTLNDLQTRACELESGELEPESRWADGRNDSVVK